MEFVDLPLNGAKLITLPCFEDERGAFVKTFNDTAFMEKAGIQFDLKESYFSISQAGVIRGMHFQLPPYDHAKIVFCPKGAILDVIVDLRSSSPTYGRFEAQVLSGANNKAYYIPKGFAHGFKSLEHGTLTYYLVSSGYHQASDTGVRWDSFGFDWDCEHPVLSERDRSFPALETFRSPF